MQIKKNLGTVDSAIRIVVGVVLLLVVPLAFVGPRVGWAAAGLLGLFPLIAGIVGYCPTYALLGIDTRDRADRDATKEDDHLRLARS